MKPGNAGDKEELSNTSCSVSWDIQCFMGYTVLQIRKMRIVLSNKKLKPFKSMPFLLV